VLLADNGGFDPDRPAGVLAGGHPAAAAHATAVAIRGSPPTDGHDFALVAAKRVARTAAIARHWPAWALDTLPSHADEIPALLKITGLWRATDSSRLDHIDYGELSVVRRGSSRQARTVGGRCAR
jgi:hypothetical protein